MIVLLLIFLIFAHFYNLNSFSGKDNKDVSFKKCENIPMKGDFMSSSKYGCYLNSLRKSVKLYGFVKTAQAFDQYINQTDQVDIRGACHSWAHELGETAVRDGASGNEIINYCVHTCLDGCFNGAGHAYVATHSDLSDVNNFCNPENMQVDNKKKDTCFHGIGHGLVDIFGTNIAKDIGYCDLITDKEGKAQCSHAIFMMFNSLPISRIQVDEIPENMVDFCDRLNPSYQNYCYDFSGYLTYGKTKDIKKAFINCNGVPDKNRLECFRRIGDILYLMDPRKEPNLLAQQCKIGTQEEVLWCSLGIGKLLITDANSPPEKSFEVCSSFEGELKLSCYKELGEQLESHRSRKDRGRLCALLDKPFSNECLGI